MADDLTVQNSGSSIGKALAIGVPIGAITGGVLAEYCNIGVKQPIYNSLESIINDTGKHDKFIKRMASRKGNNASDWKLLLEEKNKVAEAEKILIESTPEELRNSEEFKDVIKHIKEYQARCYDKLRDLVNNADEKLLNEFNESVMATEKLTLEQAKNSKNFYAFVSFKYSKELDQIALSKALDTKVTKMNEIIAKNNIDDDIILKIQDNLEAWDKSMDNLFAKLQTKTLSKFKKAKVISTGLLGAGIAGMVALMAALIKHSSNKQN